MKRRLLRIIVDGCPDISQRVVVIDQCEYEITDYPIGSGRSWQLMLKAFFIPIRLRKFDGIITSEYFSSFGINLRLLATLSTARHVTVGLNQSRRLLKTGIHAIDAVLNRIFRRGNLYITHSRRELVLFKQIHNLPPERLAFSHWGFDNPGLGDDIFRAWPNHYVSLIGRNNRDFELFYRICDHANYDGIVICSSRQQLPSYTPPNIRIFRDLDMNGAMSCIRHACANLILVKDDERGAGHITAVAGMHLGTPQIVSSVEVLSDYFINHYNCIKVPVGADAATRHAVEKLLQYSSLTQQLVANGRNYAAKWLTHEAATQRMFRAIDRVFREEKTQEADPEWLAFMGSFSEIHSDGRESASESI